MGREKGDVNVRSAGIANSIIRDRIAPNSFASSNIDSAICSGSMPPTGNSASVQEDTMVRPKEIAFIDRAVSDLESLLAGLRPDVEPVVLSTSELAPAQIANAVKDRVGLEAIQPDTALKGPDRADVPTAIAALITERNARTSEVGVVRGDEVKLPDPWLVDVTHPGTSCVQPQKPVVLWRSGELGESPINFAPKDRSWNIHGKWPARADRLALPPSMPLRDRTDYVVDVGGRLAPVTVRLIPESVNNDAMRASYMLEVGCGNQVNALLALYQK